MSTTAGYVHSVDRRGVPLLYDLRDRAPNLVNFQVERGVYIVPRVLESGYLAIGKEKLVFTKAGE